MADRNEASLTAPVVPTQPQERLLSLDVLRAFALLGILVVNMGAFNMPWWDTVMPETHWPAWWDRAALWIVDALFSGKFNSLFAFLFGVGFAIQIQRLSRGGHSALVYLRRLGVLFLFGVAHALLIWDGDVLHMYAILGVFLLLLRRVPDKWVLGLIIAGLLMPTAVSTYYLFYYTPARADTDRGAMTTMREESIRAYAHGSYWDATIMRAKEMKFIYSDPRGYFFYPQLFLTVLLGFYVGRRNYIQEADQRPEFVRKVQWWSLAVGSVCALTFVIGLKFVVPFQPRPVNVLISTAYGYARPALMLFYASTLIRLLQSERMRPWVAPLAFTGRMPLTNYLVQSVFCTLIFYGYGLGFYSKCGPALGLALSFAIFSLQIPWSRWWLRHYQFGPAEWLWRALTYGKAPALRNPLPESAANAHAAAN